MSEHLEDLERELALVNQKRTKLLSQIKNAKYEQRIAGKYLQLNHQKYPKTAKERVTLFLDMFGARRDVFPRYWQNLQKNTKGYSPVCQTVWEDGQRVRATEIYKRFGRSKFSPLNEQEIEQHLLGQQTVGTYAISTTDSCIFIAADFDGDGWKTEAKTYQEMAHYYGLDALLEISRSGNGGHVWIFLWNQFLQFWLEGWGVFCL